MSLWHKRNIHYKLLFTCFIAGLCFAFTSKAQNFTTERPENKWLSLAKEQYNQGFYRNCEQSLRQYFQNGFPFHKNMAEARFYLYSSLLKLNAIGCEDSAKQLLSNSTDPAYRERIAYELGQYYFANNQLNEAITYYEMAGFSNLSNSEIIDKKFELAYCYFSTKQFDKSEPLLISIKELKEGKYYSAGNYYYGLLAFNENNYTDALQSFDRIKSLPQYKSIVPYYIAEIYYYTGNRKKALDYSIELIASKDKLYYDNELHLLAAQCLFEDQKYSEALPYFEYYYQHADKIRKEDLYEMAYCYYKGEQWDNAIGDFKQLSNTRDSLGQTSMYLLGDCYLKTNDKKSARNAFGLCAEMPFNHGQQEASMILYARLSYEMGYHDDAINQLNNLLSTYSNSIYKDEAKTMLSDLLTKTGNYLEAFDQLDDVEKKDNRYNSVYQKVTYGYAMQLLQQGELQRADSFLSLSLKNPINDNYTATAYFWKGELAYRMQHFADAVSYSQRFLEANKNKRSIQRISPEATAQHANITIGYASMELKDFDKAQSGFNHAKTEGGDDSIAQQVATVREADAVFLQKDYAKAISLYDQIIANGGNDVAYAKFQKSKLLGLQGKKPEKVALLQSIINEVPVSKYANSAHYELASEYLEEKKYSQAITAMQPLTENVTARAFASKAWMKIGFAYQQTDNDEKALDAYKHVAAEYPSSEEYSGALDAIKSIYVEAGHPEQYSEFMKHNNVETPGMGEMDSTYYASAEAQFAAAKWEKARDAFSEYLHTYPKGVFTLKAHYYRAESNYQLKNTASALPDYDTVLQYAWNDFSENSALRAANISLAEKNNDAAMKYYMLLRNSAMSQDKLRDAYKGLVITNYNTGKYETTIAYADTVIGFPAVDESSMSEAMLYKARSLKATNKTDDAINIYRQLDNTKYGIIAAEARYNIAEMYLNHDQLKEAESAANNNIKQSAGYDYWIVKSYILLADILTKEKDYFNAKATLQSIVKNTKIQELKEEAAEKLEKVKKVEKQHSKLEEK